MRILIANAQVPFARGGAEILAESLRAELERRGHQAEIVALPYTWRSREELVAQAAAWRLLDLAEVGGERVDLLIATRFPSYLVRHPRKVVWLVHQLRQIYDLKGTRHSDFVDHGRDAQVIETVRAMDRQGLGEARQVFTISRHTAERLARFNGLTGTPLHPPPATQPLLRPGPYGDYVFTAGRLNAMKRFDLLLRAVAAARRPVRCRIAGSGPEREALAALAVRLGIADRVELLGWVDERQLAELYSGALGVYYAPFDEDYGYVTVEAFLSAKPVLTAADSGGVLEFAQDGVNACVAPAADPAAIGRAIDRLWDDRELAARLGRAGRERVAGISWDAVVAALLGDPAGGG